MAHLSDLLVNKELQVVVLLILQVFGQLLDFLLQLRVGFLGVIDLVAEKLALLGKLLLRSQLARECVDEERSDHVADVLQVVNEHHVAQLLLHILVTPALVRQVILLVPLDPRNLAVLTTAERLSQQLIESDQVVLDPLILLLGVVSLELIQVLLAHVVRQSLARMHVLVDLHEHSRRVGDLRPGCHVGHLRGVTGRGLLDMLQLRAATPSNVAAITILVLLFKFSRLA